MSRSILKWFSRRRFIVIDISFIESEECQVLCKVVVFWVVNYGYEYYLDKVCKYEYISELWVEVGKFGFLGVNLFEEYGGGGVGMYELLLVMEEMVVVGLVLLLMVVLLVINGIIIVKFGIDDQKKCWLLGIVDGLLIMVFVIIEFDVGFNLYKIIIIVCCDGSDWIIKGQKVFIFGIDQVQVVLVVGCSEEVKIGKLCFVLFVVFIDVFGFSYILIEMELVSFECQFQVFFDDVWLFVDVLVGVEDVVIVQFFVGLNFECIMGVVSVVGMGWFVFGRVVDYVKICKVWFILIGVYQGLVYLLVQCYIEVEFVKLMIQKVVIFYDYGDDFGVVEVVNMVKYVVVEVFSCVVDQVVQLMGGNGFIKEYGVVVMMILVCLVWIVLISCEMVLNFVVQILLGLFWFY